jgi:hypothetical protein
MRRNKRTRSLLVAAVVTVALAAIANGPAAAPTTVNGTVGPGFTIGLRLNGKTVTRLRAGTYRFVISDQANIHDFHLTGPGVDRVITAVGFVGTKSVVLKLKKGRYHYQCDPHFTFMHGRFVVG